jgi:hypothetical protein
MGGSIMHAAKIISLIGRVYLDFSAQGSETACADIHTWQAEQIQIQSSPLSYLKKSQFPCQK